MTGAGAALQQARVREAWQLIEVMERIGPGQTATLFAPHWEATRQLGQDFFAPFADDPWFSQPVLEAYRSPTNLTRFARTVDFIRPGDRVLEIGVGHGVLAALALRAGQAGAYRGIELEDEYVTVTQEALAAGGYDDRATVEQGDLYDLTREKVAERGADLVICCEVLEHVPDPELALKTLADSLPEGTDLLVSVPLRGRLESFWEHIAQFGVARLREMARAAGLTVQHVEPCANTWVLMLASRGPGGDRAAVAAAAEPDVTADLTFPDDWSRSVENVTPEPVGSKWSKNLASHTVESAEQGVRLQAAALAKQPGEGSRYAGVAFGCREARGIRFEVDPIDIDQVEAFYGEFYTGSERIGRWKWVPSEGRPKLSRPTFTLQPQNKGTFFKRQQAQDLRAADRFELFAQLPPGGTVTIDITQIGWFH